MVKILHTSDIHFGYELGSKIDPNTGLNLRILDYFCTFDKLVDYAFENNIDVFLIAGDVYKNRTPSLTLQREFTKRLVRLVEGGKEVILLRGNHDTPFIVGKAHTLEIYNLLKHPKIHVADSITTLTVCGIRFLTIPHNTLPVDELIKEIQPHLSQKVIAVPHLLVEGAKAGPIDFVMDEPLAYSRSLFQYENMMAVLLGDVHKFQVLQQQPPIIYCGSMEKVDFGEEKEQKGFVVLTATPEEVLSWEFIPLQTRKYLTLDLNLTQNETVDETDLEKQTKGAVVRIRATIKKGQKFDWVPTNAFHYTITKEIETGKEAVGDVKWNMPVQEGINEYFKDFEDKEELVKLTVELMGEIDESRGN